MVKKCFVEFTWCRGARELGETGGGRPIANLLAVHTVCGVAEAKKEHQWSLSALLMALKYAVLAHLAEARRAASKRSRFEKRRAEL